MGLPQKRPPGNYLVRHWRGEFTLGIAYWVNGGILAGIVPWVLFAVTNHMEHDGFSLRATSSANMAALLLSVIASIWSVVGTWRSASHHVERGGKPVWASVARTMIVLGIIAMAGNLYANVIPQVKELALIAVGHDPIGKLEIKIAPNGQSVILNGTLREGSATEVSKILDAAPSATLLVLNSNGGRLFEAEQLAHVVQNRHLDTYVEGLCASACTFVFLAGKNRAATPNARIGFHQPDFPGFDTIQEEAATQRMMNVYRTAGLPEAFIEHISKTSPENMWYPTRDELVASHVITRISLGGDAATSGLSLRSKQDLSLVIQNEPQWQAIEHRFPGSINEAVERGWAAKERGGNDADIMNAMRSVTVEIYPKLLAMVNVSTLDSFLKLLIDEMQAARAVSSEACVKLLASQLDLTKTLPNEVVDEEQKFMMRALAEIPRKDVEPQNPAEVKRVMQLVAASLPQQDINVVSNLKSYAKQPDLACGAMIAFYQGVEALSPNDRNIALQGLFQRHDNGDVTQQQDPVNVYVIPLDDFPVQLAEALSKELSKELRINVKASLPMGSAGLTPFPDATQFAAEDIIGLASPVIDHLPERSESCVYVLLTRRDINEKARHFRFFFSWADKSRRATVISIARMSMHPVISRDEAHQVALRLLKMTKRAIGEQYYHLPRSSDIRDVMYAPIMSIDDIDRMGNDLLALQK